MLSRSKYNCWALITIYLILINSNVSVECMKNQNNSIVRNLSVSIFQDQASNKIGTLKFNISWLPPPSSNLPSSYSIIISSISNEDKGNKKTCFKESIYYTTQNGNELQVALPKRKFSSEVSEFNIHSGCSYKIQVIANPKTNSSLHTPTIIYTVPECVNLTCSCLESHKWIPTPKIEAEVLANGDIWIVWQLDSNSSRIRAYTISFGLPLLFPKNGFPVYNKTKIITLPSTENSFLWKKGEHSRFPKFIREFTIFITAEDVRGCHGNDGSLKIMFPKRKSIIQGNITQALIGLIAICVLFIGTLGFLCLRSQKAYNTILFDKNLPRSRRIDLILQNRNILYVEQDIEDANDKTSHEKYEVRYDRVKIIKELGRGEFGRVYLASLEGRKTPVAVKMSLSDPVYNIEARSSLLEEIETIKAAGPHPHLVGLIGFCTSPKNPVCLILEYMEGGDLLSYLQNLNKSQSELNLNNSTSLNHNPSITETAFSVENQTTEISRNENNSSGFDYIGTFTNIDVEEKLQHETKNKVLQRNQVLCFALQIALGMKHLESKKIIHRDLAARNVLIDSNLNLKISDFGLSRNGVYVMGNVTGGVHRLPIRWMPPEALRERAFSSKSDIWSFAVVLWEIGTLGKFPYSDILDDHQLLKYILGNRGRLPRPERIDDDIYHIMTICWASTPEQRPSFAELVTWLNFLEESYCSIENNIGRNNTCYSCPFPGCVNCKFVLLP